ncbi:MAG TPA: alpha/beta hydrolase-fold protein [Anaerolineaceae bacterium]|nr:alpha/beta hydrolase-fold protein [Anaerolineaceae bacterium]
MAQDLLTRAQTEGTPLIDGQKVTFVYTGDRPPRLIGDFNYWDPSSAPLMQPLTDGVWTYEMEFPLDAYIEYAYWFGDGRGNDPFNRRQLDNGTGNGEMNNYFSMPAWKATPLVRKRPGLPAGSVSTHVLHDGRRLANRKRSVYLYQPAVEGPVPLLVVFDGRDYYRRGKLTRILDNLIARGSIRPVAMALVDNAGPSRYVEYACSDSTVSFILNQVLPLARREMDLLDPELHPGSYGLLGASMGGLMAIYTAFRVPQFFGYAICQAGAFSLDHEDFSIFDLVERGQPPSVHIQMDVGHYDFLYETNLRMVSALRQNGYDFTFREYNGGHNYTSWRNHVAENLIACLPAGEKIQQ